MDLQMKQYVLNLDVIQIVKLARPERCLLVAGMKKATNPTIKS